MNNTKNDYRVLVLGGFGFIGSHVVAVLEKTGATVIIGSRCKKKSIKNCSNHIEEIQLQNMTTVEQWTDYLQDIDVVVNTVGILRQRKGETYEQVHHLALEVLANACVVHQVRLVHVSVLGLENNHHSRFLTSKLKGETALQKSCADWYLIRPSLVDGVGGYGAKWFRRAAEWPIHFAPNNAVGKIAPIDVKNLGGAIAKIALHENPKRLSSNRIFELGGVEQMGLFEHQNRLRKSKPHKRQIRVPSTIARLISHICDLLHVTPFSFGHYELLKFDNVPKENLLEIILGKSAVGI